ncbi:glycosyltransferase [Pontibacter cellulosilyticus]|uniref:Glycosyltransferase n=1 Tax=Pontibacter cellulosilyticus TaxID=1720253 RepID=A0A923N224_9BACT|nr:glycosyltransferase [Pontibacter cellulosilyticus]MBC5991440.1 glycosyltransferase [Pontibacter cellulosilyticus]
MSEKRILLASLLKPINDTRMYEKLGLSISKIPNTQVHICGFSAPVPASAPTNITFHPIFKFKRLSVGRFTAQFDYYRLLLSVKPAIVIVCTHELLLTSLLYCRKYKAKLVYDVQENYALNLRSQFNYAALVKQLLAFGVESIERFSTPSVSSFILAERCYANELTFLKDRFIILENKYKRQPDYTLPNTPVSLPDKQLRLLYSGSISEEYGILEAIALADRLYTLDKNTTLTIIGYCSNSHTWQKVQEATKGKSYISIIGGTTLVPHTDIIREMQQSTIGLLPYRPNQSTANCIPTKLYEYMAHGLIILISQNPLWQGIVQQHQAGLSVAFESINAAELVKQLRQQQFYTKNTPKDIFWDEEEPKLLDMISNMIR